MGREREIVSNEQIKTVNSADATPESLLENFRGPGLVKIVILAIVFHVVVIAGTSMPYLKRSFFGEKTGELTKEMRIEKAVGEATEALKKIAAANGLNPQDIRDNFVPAGARAPKADAAAAAAKKTGKDAAAGTAADVKSNTAPAAAQAKVPADNAVATPDKPESKIEKDLKKAVEGPKVPGVGEKDDIF